MSLKPSEWTRSMSGSGIARLFFFLSFLAVGCRRVRERVGGEYEGSGWKTTFVPSYLEGITYLLLDPP